MLEIRPRLPSRRHEDIMKTDLARIVPLSSPGCRIRCWKAPYAGINDAHKAKMESHFALLA
jgi:hypothetical protein